MVDGAAKCLSYLVVLRFPSVFLAVGRSKIIDQQYISACGRFLWFDMKRSLKSKHQEV